MIIKRYLISFLFFFLSFNLYGDNIENEKLYNKIITELRCMVCQNQNIAESEAPLAIDLRNKVKIMITDGYDERYIKQYMADRYLSLIHI